MKHLKLFEEMNIEEEDFPWDGHDLSTRERKIITDLVGDYLTKFEIKVDDHYYYASICDSIARHIGYYNEFDTFNKLKDYVLSWYYMDNDPEEFLELLKTSKLDPSHDDNRSIWWASLNGYKEIVKLLLSDPRVDPSDGDNCSIKWASEKGKTEIVKLLLSDPRVDPSDGDNFSIRWARSGGHKDIVRLLLNDQRVRSKLSLEEINKYTNEVY